MRPALAGKADRHLLPGLLAEQVQGHGGQVGHGLVQVVERLLHIVGVERVQIEDLVFGSEFLGHNGRIVQFRKGGVRAFRRLPFYPLGKDAREAPRVFVRACGEGYTP